MQPGIIFQIRDDIFDYYDSKAIGKPTGNDMAEGKLTLPIIYALKHGDNPSMTELAYRVKNRNIDAAGIAELVDFAKVQGGIEYADKRMWDFHKDCMSFIDQRVKNDEIKEALKAYLDFVIERNN